MITEDYVSFEIAKLLKEKGFNSHCHFAKKIIEIKHKEEEGEWMSENEDLTYIPTLQMAMKWLREVHNIHIEVKYFFEPHIYKYTIIYTPVALDNISSHPLCFNTYEQACEAAINYCLENLI